MGRDGGDFPAEPFADLTGGAELRGGDAIFEHLGAVAERKPWWRVW